MDQPLEFILDMFVNKGMNVLFENECSCLLFNLGNSLVFGQNMCDLACFLVLNVYSCPHSRIIRSRCVGRFISNQSYDHFLLSLILTKLLYGNGIS